MEITLRLILDELQYQYEGDFDIQRKFEYAELLTPDFKGTAGTLFVCPLSEALEISDRGWEPCFLCTRDRITDNRETPEKMQGIVVLQKNLDIRTLFNEVQRIFFRIQNWQMDMQRSVVQDNGMQALVAMSEPIIGNHIAVMDSTFKLLAYTQNIETDDPVTNELVKHGYHTEETIKRFQLHRRFEQFAQANDIVVSEDFVTSDYVTVKKIFRYRNTYSVLVVMVCCGRPYSQGILDLYKLFLDNLQTYVDRDYPPEKENAPNAALVEDLLTGKIGTTEEIRSRASYVGMPFTGTFDLFVFQFEDRQNIPLNRLVQGLADLPLSAGAIPYDKEILLLNCYKTGTERETQIKALKGVFGTLSVTCGASNPFDNLGALRMAYEQATAAITLGKKTSPNDDTIFDGLVSGGIYFYEEVYISHLLTMALAVNEELIKSGFAFSAIEKLKGYEKKNHIPYLKILHIYLQCDRRATETCNRLHMHRNTVLYHISKIEEKLGVTLDDSEVRLKLVLGLRIYALESHGEYGSQQVAYQ